MRLERYILFIQQLKEICIGEKIKKRTFLKRIYINFFISKFLRLTNEEAYAIRFHMGFSEEGSGRNAGKAFEKYPLALALNVADMEASYYVDDKTELEIEE